MPCHRWIAHSSPVLGEPEAEKVRSVILRNFVGMGEVVSQLERRFSGRIGRQHIWAVLSGTQALCLAINALDLPPGSPIAIPVLTCGNLLHVVLASGHLPCLVDIKDDFTIDVDSIPENCVAVIAPHAYGAPVDVAGLERRAIPWIEDCATSPDTTVYDGRWAGSSGTLSVFSFSSTKYLTGGTGGLLCTQDDNIAKRVDDLLDPDCTDRKGKWNYCLVPSVPGRMSDLNAAVVLAQLDRLPSFTLARKKIGEHYDAGLRGATKLTVPLRARGHSLYRYVVKTSCSAAQYLEPLREIGIDARTSTNPWLDELADSMRLGHAGGYPNATAWKRHLLSLPIHPGLSMADADRVVGAVRSIANDLDVSADR